MSEEQIKSYEVIQQLRSILDDAFMKELRNIEFSHRLPQSVINLLNRYDFNVVQQGTNVLIIDNYEYFK
jgi:flavoprotein